MNITNIMYPTALEKITNIQDDNIDVIIEYDNGMEIVIVVSTPKNYYTLMERNEKKFVEPGPPDLIVKELSKKTIEDAIYAYADDDSYWLKVFSLSSIREKAFDKKLLDEMLEDIKRQNWEIDNA